ncbi:MAG TPA: ABC transporter permease [Candidatus Angelobacter sp.]|nr:ABC transporter permease [Candidatus Angelobacter sp.]
MKTLFHDIRRSIRSLRKAPGFTWIAVTTLAVGIAANVVVYSIIDAVILRPLPVKNAKEIVVVRWRNAQMQPQSEVSAPVFFLLKDQAQTLQKVAAVYPQEIGVNLGGIQSPRYVTALRVSEGFFSILGVGPKLGRVFAQTDDQARAPGTVVLSYGLWQSTFNGDSEAIGRVIKINGAPFTIIGIMPEGFRSFPNADIWIPLYLNPANADPGSDYLVLASLKKGVVIPGAERELESLLKAHPLSYLPSVSSAAARLRLEPLEELRTGRFRRNLSILFSAVVLVLLVACTNLMVLILVRGFSRTQEFAVRAALGSTRGKLMRVFLIESLLLALLGGAIGVALAKELLPLVLSFLPVDLVQAGVIQMNRQSLLFALALSLLVALVVGLVPAMRVSGSKIQEMLREAQRGATATLRQTRAAQVLVGLETALAVIILGTALLLLQSFLNLERVNAGFDSQQVWVAQLSLAADRYGTTQSSARLLDHVVSKLKASFEVESVGSIDGLPLEKGLNLPIYPTEKPGKINHAVEYRIVDGDYFQSLRIPLVAGRYFSSSDDASGHSVAIINQTLARKWWPQESAIGHFIHAGEEVGFGDYPREIVGVAADVHDAGLGLNPPAVVFVPAQQVSDSITAFVNKVFLASLVVRTKGRENLSQSIRDAVLSVDPDLPIASLRPMSQVVAESLSIPMFYAWLTSSFALFALFFTAVGVYGLLSYQVSLRAPEIGLRMAIGATRLQIVILILKRGTQLALIGMTLGLIVSAFLGRVLSNMLYNSNDVFLKLLVGEALLLASVASLASLLTAVRASVIEPMTILRNQ